MKPKQTRNRPKRPAWTYNGLDLAQWQSLTDLVQWAQTAPQFKDLFTVLTNERRRAFLIEPGVTENRALGRLEGYETALIVLRSLADGLTAPSKGDPEPTYAAPDADSMIPDFRD